MKKLTTKLRNAAKLAFAFFLIYGRTQAQMPCTLQTVISPSAANPNSWSMYAYLAGDSICNSFNPQYTWTIYGNPNITLTGPQVTHTFSSPGYYMVCVLAAYQGMTSSTCDTIVVQSGGPDCTPYFTAYTQGLQASFSLAGTVPSSCFNGNTVYNWSFGDSSFATVTGNTGTDHLYTSSGTYNVCLSAASANGQIYTSCSAVTINANQGPFSLGGMVQGNGTCLINESVLVEMYGIGNNYYQSMTINGGPDSCFYYFQTPFTTQPAQYIIRATPMTNPNYLPTYYGNTSFWGDATFIAPNMNGWNYHINLIPVYQDSIPAIGTVSGTIAGNGITVSTNIGGSAVVTQFNVQACRVIILNDAGQSVGFALVNADGSYSFGNLPEGDYSLRVDHPKVSGIQSFFSISPGNTSASMNFTATENSGIVNITEAKSLASATNITIRPNPAENEISLNENLVGKIFNSQGKEVLSIRNQNTVSIIQLPSGIYHFSGKDSKGRLAAGRFVKK